MSTTGAAIYGQEINGLKHGVNADITSTITTIKAVALGQLAAVAPSVHARSSAEAQMTDQATYYMKAEQILSRNLELRDWQRALVYAMLAAAPEHVTNEVIRRKMKQKEDKHD